MSNPRTLLYAAIAGPFLVAPVCGAWADDLRLDNPPARRALSTDVDAAIAEKNKTQAADSDLSARVDELESARAAVKKPAGSGVSLSVSGWVAEQVIIAK